MDLLTGTITSIITIANIAVELETAHLIWCPQESHKWSWQQNFAKVTIFGDV